jgi:hypothetical protein
MHFGSSVDLTGLFVADMHHDTLLYAKSLQVRLRQMDLKGHFLGIKSFC